MHFLIDLENVHSEGLKGCRFLKQYDTIEFFYSENVRKIDAYRLEQIEQSGCNVKFYKLKSPGKNALDFYIVSRLGQLTAENKDAEIAIISKDNGFQSCIEYYDEFSDKTYPVILASDMRTAITRTKNPVCKERRQELAQSPELEDLEMFKERISQRQNLLEKKIADMVSGTKYASRAEEIYGLIDSASTSRRHIYLGMLRLFGREDGLGLYHMLKKGSFAIPVINA